MLFYFTSAWLWRHASIACLQLSLKPILRRVLQILESIWCWISIDFFFFCKLAETWLILLSYPRSRYICSSSSFVEHPTEAVGSYTELFFSSACQKSCSKLSMYINNSWWVIKENGASLFSFDILWQHKRQWAQAKTQEFRCKHMIFFFNCENDQMLAWVSQKCHGVWNSGDLQQLPEHGPGWPVWAVIGPFSVLTMLSKITSCFYLLCMGVYMCRDLYSSTYC